MKLQIKQKFISGLFLFILCSQNHAEGEADRYRQAGLPSTTADVFEHLAKDEHASIRQRVASNRKTPVKILMALAHDTDMAVRISVATNLSTNEETYLDLARDPEQAVRSVVARFEYVPVPALILLSKDHDVDIRIAVARNLNSTKAILNMLINDKNNNVSSVAEQALMRLAEE